MRFEEILAQGLLCTGVDRLVSILILRVEQRTCNGLGYGETLETEALQASLNKCIRCARSFVSEGSHVIRCSALPTRDADGPGSAAGVMSA